MLFSEVKLSIQIGLLYVVVVQESQAAYRHLRKAFDHLTAYTSCSHH